MGFLVSVGSIVCVLQHYAWRLACVALECLSVVSDWICKICKICNNCTCVSQPEQMTRGWNGWLVIICSPSCHIVT